MTASLTDALPSAQPGPPPAGRDEGTSEGAPAAPAFTMRDVFRDRDTFWRFAAILGLQMGQVFPAAFFGLILTAIYREKGLSLDMFWVFTLPAVPNWLRPLWAPVVDRIGSDRFGRRKSWILPCTTLGALAYLAVGFFEPELAHLWFIIGLLTLKSVVMATQDIAVDAYTVEHLSDRERAAGAGVLDIARNVASFSAMAGIVTIYGIYGWRTATVVASLLLVLFSLPALLRRETPRAGSSSAVGAPRPSLLAMLKRPDSHLVLPVVMVVGFVGALISSLYVAYLVDMGFSTKEIGPLILAPASLLGTLIGATVTVWVLSRIGYRRTILLAAFLMVPTVGPIVWMGSLSPPSMLIVFLVTLNAIVLPTFLQVAIAASRMKWVLKSQAGTDFSVQVVAVSIAANAALAIGGVLAEALGWFWYFILSGVLVVAGCFVFYIAFARIEALVEARDRAIDEGDRRAEAERAAPEAAQPPLRSSDSPAV